MLYDLFVTSANNNLDKKALNDLTYRDLLFKIDQYTYQSICDTIDENVIIAILNAAKYNKPLTILPKYKRNPIEKPIVKDEFSLMLASSGSTGTRKFIQLSGRMLVANARVAIASQGITEKDNIFTVCSLNHTGGINAQTIAGLLVGAHVIVEPFNAFNFFRLINYHSITISHLVPVMIDALIKLNNQSPSPSLRLMVAGSDCVYQRHVKFWIDNKINFMMNYGLTEAGPLIINHTFYKEDYDVFNHGVPLGTNAWCETKIVDGELFLQGNNVATEGWLATGDCVYLKDGWFMYQGRRAAGCKILPKQY
jgi:acyl-CoA synthetase (AMP-forming)/AMP-acid ligase II